MSLGIKKDFQNKRKPDYLSSLIYGKVPPQALEIEQAVLGAIMLEKEKIADVLRIIKSADVFYSDSHRKIYTAITHLYTIGSAVDLLTVTEQLRKQDDLEIIGGPYYLSELTMTVVSSAHVEAHARIVMEKHILRELIRISGHVIGSAYEDSADVFDLLEKAQGDFISILDHIRTGNIKSFGASLLPTIRAMEEARGKADELVGIPTGLSKLDKITDGFSAPDMVIIAAGTGEGKTTFALNSAEQNAAAGVPAAFFSLEMRDRQLIWKMLSKHLREQIKDIRKGGFSEEKWHKLRTEDFVKLSKLPLYFYDIGGLDIIELKGIARTMVQKHGVRIIYIDYLQLIRGAGKNFGTREQEVNFISKELKALAMELDVPIIVLSQLSRLEKNNAKRMYRLSDLRESGAIEQDADGIIFIYRPLEHGNREMNIGGEDMYFTGNDVLFDIGKWRLGQTGTFRATFEAKYNSFTDYEMFATSFATPGFEESTASPYTEGIRNTTVQYSVPSTTTGSIDVDSNGDDNGKDDIPF